MLITVPIGCALPLAIVNVTGAAAVPPNGAGVMVAPGGMPGQLTIEVSGASALAGTVVCAQDKVALTAAAPGTQLRPIAGAFAPNVAGAVMVRFAPAVIAKADAPVGAMVQASAKLAPAVPAVVTVTATIPVPPISVEVAAMVAVTGAAAGVAAGQVKPQTRDTGAPAFSVHVSVAVPAVAARVQPKSIEPAAVT